MEWGHPKATGAPKGKWGAERQMGHQKANRALKGPKGKSGLMTNDIWSKLIAWYQLICSCITIGKAMYPRTDNEASQIDSDSMRAMKPIKRAINLCQ